MKYNVFETWWEHQGRGEFVITSCDFDTWKALDDKPNGAPRKHMATTATVHYTTSNKAEMLQHAQKIADYFEQVDTAKEAVIRCTKI